MSRRDPYGNPEDYEDPPAWLREPSPVVLIVLVLFAVGMLGVLACRAIFVLGWLRG